jgi:dihydrofolate synthase / folylpolyglutamate synthase
MNYQETLDWLFSQLPMYQRIGKAAYKADLINTHKLDSYFNHPHTRFKSIHIAGTNGKGSVSHMLASVLQTAGYKVGLYTSPHLKDFRERIRINGQMIPESEVVDFVIIIRIFLKKFSLLSLR